MGDSMGRSSAVLWLSGHDRRRAFPVEENRRPVVAGASHLAGFLLRNDDPIAGRLVQKQPGDVRARVVARWIGDGLRQRDHPEIDIGIDDALFGLRQWPVHQASVRSEDTGESAAFEEQLLL